MNTNEKELNNKIAVWLGMAIFKKTGQIVYPDEYKGIIPDFLHHRNQQKWIEDELVKREYYIKYEYDPELRLWSVEIYKMYIIHMPTQCYSNINQFHDRQIPIG